MANELKHGTVGTELTQAEWEGIGTHVFSSQATGDLAYASSATQLSRLAISGTATHILSISGGVPVWAAPAAAAAGSLTGSTLASGVTASSLTSVGTLTDLTVSGTSTTIGTVTSGIWNAGAVTSSGLITGTDLSISGTSTTIGTVTSGVWEGTDVGVAHGGTGVSSLTDGGVLLGNGTGSVVAMAVLTDGQMIVGDGTTDPVAESGTDLRTSIGVGTADAVEFAGITGTTIDATTDFTIGDTEITDGVITDTTGLQLAANLDINGTADISGDLTLSAGGDGALQFSVASSIKIVDDTAAALVIEEADNAYMTFVTTNSSEAITIAKATTFSAGIANAGTIAAGTWNGTDVGVAYGGTGVSTLTDGGILLGSGASAITAMAVLTDGQMIVGDGTTDPVAESGTVLRTSIGVGTGDSPQFSKFSIGGALDNQEQLRIYPNTAPTTGSATIFPVMQTTGGTINVTGQTGAILNHRFGGSTLTADSTTTPSLFATVYITGPASLGSNVPSIDDDSVTGEPANYAFYVDGGKSKLDGDLEWGVGHIGFLSYSAGNSTVVFGTYTDSPLEIRMNKVKRAELAANGSSLEFFQATELNMYGTGSSITNVGASGNDWTATNLSFAAGSSITTDAGDLTLNPYASLNVTLTDDDGDSLTFANSASNFYNIDTRNTAVGTSVHQFDAEDATMASASAAVNTMALFKQYQVNWSGTTTVTSLQATVNIDDTILYNDEVMTLNKATALVIQPPRRGHSNLTVAETSGLRILDASTAVGAPAIQSGIHIEDMTAGTLDYGLYIADADTYAIFVDGGLSRFDGDIEMNGGGDIETATGSTIDIQVGNGNVLRATDNGASDYQALLAPGKNSLPGISFTNDTDTGMYRSGGDEISFALNGGQEYTWTTSDLNMRSNTLSSVGASGNDWTQNAFALSNANAGGYNTNQLNNTSTAANSHALMSVVVDGTDTTSDPFMYFARTTGTNLYWSIGMDNSNNQLFKISNTENLGSRDVLVLDGRIAGSAAYTRMTLSNADPVLDNSATANFIMLDIPNSDPTITGATTITTHQSMGMRIQTQRMSSSSTVTVNDASHLFVIGVPSPDANVTFTNSNGLYIANVTHGGTVTNQTAIKMATMTGGGTTNVGIDMGNNTLENVGAAGNDFKAATLDLASAFTIQGAGRLNVSTGTSYLAIQADDGGGGGPANRVVIGVSGIRMANNTAHGTTAGTNIISLFNGTPPEGTLANGASFFCEGGEMKVIDAAANETTLSPHDDNGQWVFHSRDDSGKVLHIQMENLMRRLDEEFGGGFIEEYIED